MKGMVSAIEDMQGCAGREFRTKGVQECEICKGIGGALQEQQRDF